MKKHETLRHCAFAFIFAFGFSIGIGPSIAKADYTLECKQTWNNGKNYRQLKILPDENGKWNIYEETKAPDRGWDDATALHDYICKYHPKNPLIFYCAKDLKKPELNYITSRHDVRSLSDLSFYPNENGIREFYFSDFNVVSFEFFIKPEPWFYIPGEGRAIEIGLNVKHPGPPAFLGEECRVSGI